MNIEVMKLYKIIKNELDKYNIDKNNLYSKMNILKQKERKNEKITIWDK